jgi:MSHA pilin protein MshC
MKLIKYSCAKKNNNGFTLVEVVIVLILVSILAVTAAKHFFGNSPYEAYTFRASLLSALRLTQQRAMQQTHSNFCHSLIINDHRYGIPDRNNCAVTDLSTLDINNLSKTSLIVDTNKYTVSFSIAGKTNPSIVGFDAMGRPLNDCDSGCDIQVSSELDNLTIRIESEGYIHVP